MYLDILGEKGGAFFMKVLAAIVLILGLACLVMGIIFTINSGSARDEVATSISPLTLDQLDAQYDQVVAGQQAMAPAEAAAIQSGQAPSALYTWMTLQRTSLGLARSNVGLASLTLTLGVLNILIGVGLGSISVYMMKRA